MRLRSGPTSEEAGWRGRKRKSREVGKEGERQARDSKGERGSQTYNEWEEVEGSGRCREQRKENMAVCKPEDDARSKE